jgi:hypothetical protein
MPEFEEDNLNASQSETYTPSTDASDKPRTRRRSGGFKTEVAPVSNAKIGEVDAAKALKEEKLSGPAKSAAGADAPTEQRERSEKPARRERSERAPRAERAPRQKREPQPPRSDANPQPSAETLAAIASVEAKINERRAERDARRAARDKNRPAKSKDGAPSVKRRSSGDSRPSSAKNPTPKVDEGGLIAAIGGFFGKLFGSAPEPSPKQTSSRSGQDRSGHPRAQSGNRGSQNRSRGGNKHGGQGRKRSGSSGKGSRRGDRRSHDNVES